MTIHNTNRNHQKGKNKTRKQKKIKCSPSGAKFKNTCLNETYLHKLKDDWNNNNNDKINTNDIDTIRKELREKNTSCKRESCIVKSSKLETTEKNEIMKHSYAPLMPKEWLNNPNAWLSSDDITAVLDQYKVEYKCFDYLGPSPIDYDTKLSDNQCVWNSICNFQLKKYVQDNFKKIGIVFNLDPHNKGGSHWVSLFIHIPRRKIYYFDSTGDKIPKQLMKFVNTVMNQGKDMGITYSFLETHGKIEHQYGDTECGMYSLYFIIQMLKKERFWNTVTKRRIKDKEMEQYRSKYFNRHL